MSVESDNSIKECQDCANQSAFFKLPHTFVYKQYLESVYIAESLFFAAVCTIRKSFTWNSINLALLKLTVQDKFEGSKNNTIKEDYIPYKNWFYRKNILVYVKRIKILFSFSFENLINKKEKLLKLLGKDHKMATYSWWVKSLFTFLTWRFRCISFSNF